MTIGQQVAKPGSALPDFKLPSLAGKEFRSSQLKGSVVVLDVWATWCEPCIADIPMFNRLHEKYTDRGLKVVGIAVQSGWAKDIKPHVAKLGIKYLVLDQNMSVIEGSLGILPRRILVGDDDAMQARRIMKDAGLAHELRPDE